MNITPYTPVKILRRYVWRTYLEQGVHAVLSASGVVLTTVNLEGALNATSWTQFGKLRFVLAALSIIGTYWSARIVISGCSNFINTAQLRNDLFHLIGLRSQMDEHGRR